MLIVDDPDAPDPRYPKGPWVHWLLYDLPSDLRRLPADLKQLPPGARLGLNDANRAGYDGPCPPIGKHRYFFRLYALDCARLDLHLPHRTQLEAAMRGHVLGVAELVGTYQRGR